MDYLKSSSQDYDMELIEKAYDLGEGAHSGQIRKSGDVYFVHPVEVAKILVELEMDSQTVAAGLLHDVVEDTKYTIKEIEEIFGEEIALLVDGVTKLGALKFETKEERQAENLRKMLLAMTKDIRVLIIKLADRLHNMRTINFMEEDKIKEKCQETLEIYAPLAHRLGISKIRFELEDLALKALEPETYYSLVSGVRMKRLSKENYLNEVTKELKVAINELNIEYEIYGRYKHYYSIYKKMKTGKTLDEIFDLAAIRIVVNSLKDCYAVLGIVHTLWKPIPGRFKDYIAMPKPNMYQSLHTTLIGNQGDPFEVQIRTKEMHMVAEYGIAAHWKYKEGKNTQEETDQKLSWLRQTIEWQQELNDPREFMESLKVDLFSNQVFVFTPKGSVIELPAGSTPLDFAFKIHSEVGIKCTGAKVNGKMVPLNYELSNGNIVEVFTNANSKGPSIDWLNIVKSGQAKNRIKQWLKKENRAENIEKGKEAIEKIAKRRGHNVKTFLRQQWLLKVAKANKSPNVEDLYVVVGYGGLSAGRVVNTLEEYYREEKKEEIKQEQKERTLAELEQQQLENPEIGQKERHSKKDASGVKVKGVDNLMIRFSKCCTPVPGDDIIGFITKGRGISVHRRDCANMLAVPAEEQGRFIEVEWDEEVINKQSYEAEINILAEDRKGLLLDISIIMQEMDINVRSLHVKTTKDKIATFSMTVNITAGDQLSRILTRLKGIPNIVDAYRTTS